MDFNQFVEHMRLEIRTEGFISMFGLAGRMIIKMNECGLVGKVSPSAILEALSGCDDICVVHYATIKSKGMRSLYYYKPSEEN